MDLPFFFTEQDAHLDNLSRSVGRQHHLSLQINDELGVHNGLLGELEHDVDHTHNRLGGARKRLETFSRGVKGNCKRFISLLKELHDDNIVRYVLRPCSSASDSSAILTLLFPSAFN